MEFSMILKRQTNATSKNQPSDWTICQICYYYKLSADAVCFSDRNSCWNYEQNILKKSNEVWIFERKS